MDSKCATLFARLEELGIPSTTVEHAPMFTVEQSQCLRGTIPGAHTKNLFLKDKDGRLVLVVAKEDTQADLKGLANRLGFGRFSFGKPELLMEVLGIEPGSVTAFALINEARRRLRPWSWTRPCWILPRSMPTR
jgi:Ala-tRNA(Pro) deacylase